MRFIELPANTGFTELPANTGFRELPANMRFTELPANTGFTELPANTLKVYENCPPWTLYDPLHFTGLVYVI